MNGKSLVVCIIGAVFFSLAITFGISALVVWLGSLVLHFKFSWKIVVLVWIISVSLYSFIEH